jgi:hypothetical protein
VVLRLDFMYNRHRVWTTACGLRYPLKCGDVGGVLSPDVQAEIDAWRSVRADWRMFRIRLDFAVIKSMSLLWVAGVLHQVHRRCIVIGRKTYTVSAYQSAGALKIPTVWVFLYKYDPGNICTKAVVGGPAVLFHQAMGLVCLGFVETLCGAHAA